MRDDNIIVRGPYESPSRWVDDDTDPDGNVIPGHLVPSGNLRYLDFESRECPCGQIHTFTMTINWDMMLGFREVAEYLIDAGSRGLIAALDDCDGAWQ